MPTYCFKVIKENVNEIPVGELVDVSLSISEYDAFKEANKDHLERYFDVPNLGFNFDGKIQPDGRFMDRMAHIQQTYPGAKGMFDNTRWSPKRVW